MHQDVQGIYRGAQRCTGDLQRCTEIYRADLQRCTEIDRGFTEVHRDVQQIYTETYRWMSLGNWLK